MWLSLCNNSKDSNFHLSLKKAHLREVRGRGVWREVVGFYTNLFMRKESNISPPLLSSQADMIIIAIAPRDVSLRKEKRHTLSFLFNIQAALTRLKGTKRNRKFKCSTIQSDMYISSPPLAVLQRSPTCGPTKQTLYFHVKAVQLVWSLTRSISHRDCLLMTVTLSWTRKMETKTADAGLI